MNVIDASYYIQENNENKGSRMGTQKNDLLRCRRLMYLIITSFNLAFWQIKQIFKIDKKAKKIKWKEQS